MMNIALKTAIVQSGKKQKRIAALARIKEARLSKIVHGELSASNVVRRRLARVLGKSEAELFAEAS